MKSYYSSDEEFFEMSWAGSVHKMLLNLLKEMMNVNEYNHQLIEICRYEPFYVRITIYAFVTG